MMTEAEQKIREHEYMKAWRAKNREKIRAQEKAHYAKNRDRILAQKKALFTPIDLSKRHIKRRSA